MPKRVQWVYSPPSAVPLYLGDLARPQKMSTARQWIQCLHRADSGEPKQATGTMVDTVLPSSSLVPPPAWKHLWGCFPDQDQALNGPVKMLLLGIEVIKLVKAALFSHWLGWNHSSCWAHGRVEIRIEKLEHQVTDPHWKHSQSPVSFLHR